MGLHAGLARLAGFCTRPTTAAKLSIYSLPRAFATGNTSNKKVDVAIVGAGHNGLVAAILLARQGLKVRGFLLATAYARSSSSDTRGNRQPRQGNWLLQKCPDRDLDQASLEAHHQETHTGTESAAYVHSYISEKQP